MVLSGTGVLVKQVTLYEKVSERVVERAGVFQQVRFCDALNSGVVPLALSFASAFQSNLHVFSTPIVTTSDCTFSKFEWKPR